MTAENLEVCNQNFYLNSLIWEQFPTRTICICYTHISPVCINKSLNERANDHIARAPLIKREQTAGNQKYPIDMIIVGGNYLE